MKKIFTLVAAAMMAVCANAQTTEWNFSEWEAKEFKQTETKDGLTYILVLMLQVKPLR